MLLQTIAAIYYRSKPPVRAVAFAPKRTVATSSFRAKAAGYLREPIPVDNRYWRGGHPSDGASEFQHQGDRSQ